MAQFAPPQFILHNNHTLGQSTRIKSLDRYRHIYSNIMSDSIHNDYTQYILCVFVCPHLIVLNHTPISTIEKGEQQ